MNLHISLKKTFLEKVTRENFVDQAKLLRKAFEQVLAKVFFLSQLSW